MTIDEVVEAVADAATWDARVAAVRLVPEQFGTSAHQAVYAAIARRVYVPSLAPDFAYVHWIDDYELEPLSEAYSRLHLLTAGFTRVDVDAIARILLEEPRVLRVFRLLLGFTAQEFAAATVLVLDDEAEKAVSVARVRSMEEGKAPSSHVAGLCSRVVDLAMNRRLFGEPRMVDVRLKTDKPDTVNGWESVRHFAENGVPLDVFLHQRQYGGAFRQLLDATSTKRGDIIEDAVDEVFSEYNVPYFRTGAHNQEEIATRFGITVKPAPDFVVFDKAGALRALLECKGANDGGTARDKAARFGALRAEATRLGGIPLFAVLAGLGWTRVADALGPVIRSTDGRTFTIPTVREMMTVQPFPELVSTQF